MVTTSIVFSMETPCWSPSEGLQHGRRKPVETSGVYFGSLKTLSNFHERLFLEAWYSQRDSNAGNEHIDISDVYKSLV